MAYLRPQDEEEQQRQAPLAPGAVSPQGGLTPGARGVSPQMTPQQREGTGGFTNLQRFLDAGAGRDKNISSTGGQLLKTEQSTYNTAKQPLENATFKATTFKDDEVGGLLGSQGGFDKLKGALGQDYTGPMSVGYDPTKGQSKENMMGLDALSSTDTAGAELAKRYGANSYGAGARRFDNAVIGADTASQAAIGANKAGGTQFLTDSGKTSADLAKKAQGFKDAAKAGRDQTRGQLQRFADKIVSDVDTRVRQANERDTATQAKLNDPKGVGQMVPQDFHYFAGGMGGSLGTTQIMKPEPNQDRWERKVTQGSGANAGNMITAEESSAIQKLAQLIGIKPIEQTGNYTPWAIEDVYTPNPRADYAEGITNRQGEAAPYSIDGAGNRVQVQDPTVRAQETPESRGMNYDSQAALQSGKYEFDFSTGGIKDKTTGEVFAPGEDGSWSYAWDPATNTLVKVGG